MSPLVLVTTGLVVAVVDWKSLTFCTHLLPWQPPLFVQFFVGRISVSAIDSLFSESKIGLQEMENFKIKKGQGIFLGRRAQSFRSFKQAQTARE